MKFCQHFSNDCYKRRIITRKILMQDMQKTKARKSLRRSHKISKIKCMNGTYAYKFNRPLTAQYLMIKEKLSLKTTPRDSLTVDFFVLFKNIY